MNPSTTDTIRRPSLPSGLAPAASGADGAREERSSEQSFDSLLSHAPLQPCCEVAPDCDSQSPTTVELWAEDSKPSPGEETGAESLDCETQERDLTDELFGDITSLLVQPVANSVELPVPETVAEDGYAALQRRRISVDPSGAQPTGALEREGQEVPAPSVLLVSVNMDAEATEVASGAFEVGGTRPSIAGAERLGVHFEGAFQDGFVGEHSPTNSGESTNGSDTNSGNDLLAELSPASSPLTGNEFIAGSETPPMQGTETIGARPALTDAVIDPSRPSVVPSGDPTQVAGHPQLKSLPPELLARATTPTSSGTYAAPNRAEVAVDSIRLLKRVARAFFAAQDRGGEVRLRLSPPELGALKLEIRVQEGTLVARLETETASARTTLLENLPALRERLAEQGMRIQRFDVDLMQRHSGGTPDQPANQQPQNELTTPQAARRARRPLQVAEGVVARTVISGEADLRRLNVIV